MANISLRIQAETLFIKRDCEPSLPIVQAAVVTAASNMACPSNIVDEQTTIEELLNAYNAQGNEEVKNLIGMDSKLLNSVIGFDVNTNDMNAVIANYVSRKEEYDFFYKNVYESSKKHTQVVERHI